MTAQNPFPDEPPVEVIARAIAAARKSPCVKSRRGCAIYAPKADLPPGDRRNVVAKGSMLYEAGDDREYVILGAGHNGQPEPYVCGGRAICGNACRTLAVHAEVRTIRAAIEDLAHFYATSLLYVGTAQLVHVKVDERGQLVAGDGPSCEQCSREILDAPLAGVWLYEAPDNNRFNPPVTGPRWVHYHAVDFHRTTLQTLGLDRHATTEDWVLDQPLGSLSPRLRLIADRGFSSASRSRDEEPGE